MVMAASAFVIVIIVEVAVLCLLQQHLCQTIRALHRAQELCACQLVPRSRDQHRVRILPADHLRSLELLLLRKLLCAAQDNGRRALDLVIVKLAEILHIHPDLRRIHNRRQGIQHQPRLLGGILDCLAHIRELTDAGRLDHDAVRGKLLRHFLQRLAKVADQRAADTAGIHLRDIDAGILQEASVNTDLAEFILNQDNLLSRKHL